MLTTEQQHSATLRENANTHLQFNRVLGPQLREILTDYLRITDPYTGEFARLATRLENVCRKLDRMNDARLENTED